MHQGASTAGIAGVVNVGLVNSGFAPAVLKVILGVHKLSYDILDVTREGVSVAIFEVG